MPTQSKTPLNPLGSARPVAVQRLGVNSPAKGDEKDRKGLPLEGRTHSIQVVDECNTEGVLFSDPVGTPSNRATDAELALISSDDGSENLVRKRGRADGGDSCAPRRGEGNVGDPTAPLDLDRAPVPIANLTPGTKVLIALDTQRDKEWLYYAEIKAVVVPNKRNRRKKPRIAASYRGYEGWQHAAVGHRSIVHVLPAHVDITELPVPIVGRSFHERNISPYSHGADVDNAEFEIRRVISTFTIWNKRHSLVEWKGYPSPFDYTIIEESAAILSKTAVSVPTSKKTKTQDSAGYQEDQTIDAIIDEWIKGRMA